jgi:catechol 2,3-dioxygenase-like lactoylglutathione lyase family enzyme
MLLKDRPAFAALPVSDPARARRFYAEKLGLTPTVPDGDFFECGDGTRFVISKMGSKPGGHTQRVFAVDEFASGGVAT